MVTMPFEYFESFDLLYMNLFNELSWLLYHTDHNILILQDCQFTTVPREEERWLLCPTTILKCHVMIFVFMLYFVCKQVAMSLTN